MLAVPAARRQQAVRASASRTSSAGETLVRMPLFTVEEAVTELRLLLPVLDEIVALRADAASKAKPALEIPSLEPGDRVLHDSFGMGTVVALEGVGDKAVASIDFGSEGVKRLLLRYAPVEKL